MRKRYLIFLFVIMGLALSCSVIYSKSGSTINLYNTTGDKSDFNIEKNGSAGTRFNATDKLTRVSVYITTFGATKDCRIALYKWDESYSKTVSSAPVAVEDFKDVLGNRWLNLNVEAEKGEYLAVVYYVKGRIGVSQTRTHIEHTVTYTNGYKGLGNISMKITYDGEPSTSLAPLSKEKEPEKVSDPREPKLPKDHPINQRNVKPETWHAIDALGRELPDYEAVGSSKKNKYVAMFYWIAHDYFEIEGMPINLTNLMKQYPEAKNDYKHRIWYEQKAAAYFWDEPLYGYYTSLDKYVYRKHAEMLANAGVDVIVFDCTNANYTWRGGYTTLLEAFAEARQAGVNTPKIAFMLNFAPFVATAEMMYNLYLDIYRSGNYQDLWFYWEGKPLVMAYPEILGQQSDPLFKEMLDFFTFRPCDPSYFTTKPAHSTYWGWLSVYPQCKYGVRPDGTVEQITVGVAQNANALYGGTAMNGIDVYGRSFSMINGFSTDPNSKYYGINFQEQWDYAIEVNPDLIFVTGWNEWQASRHEDWGYTENAFPDVFTDEYSRDVEPTKGDLKDNYYYQLISNIRKYKGVSKPDITYTYKTIDITNIKAFNKAYAYTHYVGYAEDRDEDGYGDTHYTNKGVRNDVVVSKVIYDKDYIYFYVETLNNLTDPKDPDWMRLFISTKNMSLDKSWEGFDYAVNITSPENGYSTIVKSTGGWNWEETGKAKYYIKNNVMTLAVPRSAIGQEGGKPHLYFKWADNNCSDGDILSFYTDGEAAPDGRFTFVFTPANGKHTFQVSTMFIVILVSSLLFAGAIGLLISDTIRRKKKK
ncbi:MAG: hypothetical protein ACOX3J_12775 [Clostridia bacterium]|jgi:hypothetical protein